MSPPVIGVILAGLFGLLNALLTILASRKNSTEDFSLKRRAADALDRQELEKARAELNKELLDLWHERINMANERAKEAEVERDKAEAERDAALLELETERKTHIVKIDQSSASTPYVGVSTTHIEL